MIDVDTEVGPRRASLLQAAFDMLRAPGSIVAAAMAMSLDHLFHMLPRIPQEAFTTGDSAAYLKLESFRPPLYGWFLNGWLWLHGNLAGLPSVQLALLSLALCYFSVELGLLLKSALVSLVAVPLVMLHPGIWESSRSMMTESIYLAAILAGMAAQFHFARRPDRRWLLWAGAWFGLAIIARSTGLVFLLLPLGAALLDRRRTMVSNVTSAAAAGVVTVSLMLGAMTWHKVRDGHFEIGSWAGISLLTKALLLTEPKDAAGFPPLEAVLRDAGNERALIAAQPDLAARLRAQVQAASSDLRWGVFIPTAEKTWPAWREADWRARGLLAGQVSVALIRSHPLGAISLWFNDWLAMIVQPAHWPPGWSTMTPVPQSFVACGHDDNCWALQIENVPWMNRIILLGCSAAGPIAALIVIVLNAGTVLRRRSPGPTVLFFLTAILIHATLLLTSAFEAGNVRYTVAIHVLELPLLLWISMAAARRFGLPGLKEGHRDIRRRSPAFALREDVPASMIMSRARVSGTGQDRT